MGESASRGRSPTRTEGETTVKVLVGANHIAVLDPDVALLHPLLEVQRSTFVLDGPTGCRRVVQDERFWTYDPRGRLGFSAGLLPRVRAFLEAHGYQVEVDDWRKPGPRLGASPEVLDALHLLDRAFVERLARAPQGQIEVRNPAHAIQFCILISTAFPRARIALPVATRTQAYHLGNALRGELNEPVGLAIPGSRRWTGRCVVGTFTSFPCAAATWDILLLSGSAEAAGLDACRIVPHLGARRVYALVEPRHRADDLVRMNLEAMAGPVLQALDPPAAPVRVIRVPAPPGVGNLGKTPLDRKRALYWHNRPRNDLIARIARAVATGDRQVLRATGVRTQDIPKAGAKPLRVVVLVESTEHGRALLPRLPGATLRARTSEPIAATPGTNPPAPEIVTVVYAAGNEVRADVLVRATGGRDRLNVQGFPASRRGRPALVIDLDDADDPGAAEATRRRLDSYRRDLNLIAAPGREDEPRLRTNVRNSSVGPQAGSSEVGPVERPVQRPGGSLPTPSRSSGRRE